MEFIKPLLVGELVNSSGKQIWLKINYFFFKRSIITVIEIRFDYVIYYIT